MPTTGWQQMGEEEEERIGNWILRFELKNEVTRSNLIALNMLGNYLSCLPSPRG